ncbi:Hypothetical predicted protein [Lecanosticta acicola]|uniref:Pentatricopeptide repeat domain-containing protein n=1 Tax=Lecanosticta acicola TaxID=111012 RepID=A0AAI8YTT9_9PEZI|nr:Hypothetical predicted protein [Lecanosticta acicola]
MSALLARLGPLEKRIAAQTTWKYCKRKRQSNWVCAGCTARRDSAFKQQRRSYGDDSLRFTDGGGSVLFPGEGEHEHNDDKKARQNTKPESWTGSSWEFENQGKKELGSQRIQDGPESRTFQEGAFESSYTPLGANERDEGEQDLEQDGLWEPFEPFDGRQEPGTSDSVFAADGFNAPDPRDMLDIDYRAKLSDALLQEEADVVARCLFAAYQANDLDFLRSIPPTTYSEIIRLLEPSHFVAKVGRVHVDFSSKTAAEIGLMSMHKVAREYVSVLQSVLGVRRSVGIAPTFADYTILLRSARDLGNSKMGSFVWHALLNDGHVPNTMCYNYYMSAVVWNGIHSAGSRQTVRVIPYNMEGRAREKRRSKFWNYRVGEGGVRQQTMEIFNKMLTNGVVADEESYRILITASAREGDLATAKSVLKRVWGIDVEGIMAGTDEKSIPPKQIPEHSPMRPTEDLLLTIADAFSINNDIPSALRLVDFVARHFGLAITSDVWARLLQWTFILSLPRTGTDRLGRRTTGQLPLSSVLSLWNLMTGPPYSVKPTMSMYRYLIKNIFHRQSSDWLADKIIAAEPLVRSSREMAGKRLRDVQGYTRARSKGFLRRSQEPRSLERLRNSWQFADLIRRRDILWLRRWVRLYLGTVNRNGARDTRRQHSAYRLPLLLWQWRAILPERIEYETPTGFVMFRIRSEEEIVASHKRRLYLKELRAYLLAAIPKYIGHQWFDRPKSGGIPKRLMEHLKAADEMLNTDARSAKT